MIDLVIKIVGSMTSSRTEEKILDKKNKLGDEVTVACLSHPIASLPGGRPPRKDNVRPRNNRTCGEFPLTTEGGQLCLQQSQYAMRLLPF